MAITRTTVTETVERERITEVSCDLCGHRQQAEELLQDDDALLDNTFHIVRWTAGFGSDHDMTTFEVALCDRCMALLGEDSEEKQALQQAVARLRQGDA